LLAGYTKAQEIFSNLDTHVYRALSNDSHKAVIIKIKRKPVPCNAEHNSIENEAAAYKLLNSPSCPKLIESREEQDYSALVIEDIGGESLDRLIKAQTFELAEKLDLAIEIAKSLEHIHHNELIHKDINPSNVIVATDHNCVQIIDFGLAQRPEKTGDNEVGQDDGLSFHGTLNYMSPEQTGRIGKPLDKRSDLYSLGVTLYELFCGVVPFKARSDLETLHAHIAVTPRSPNRHDSTVPDVLGAIILKLLAKSANHRYQSAFGLRKDLESCREQLEKNGSCESFYLGSQDVSELWQFPDKVYGRDNEIGELMQAFTEIKDGPKVFLVSGYSGVGKTVICNSFLDQAQTEGGIVANGKFEQLQGEKPYSAIKALVRNLISVILRFEHNELDRWKARLEFIVGQNASVLIDFVPEFSLLLDHTDEAIELNIEESSNRFNFLICGFLKLFTKAPDQLVLFLDDIHWIDPASFRLLRTLISDPELNNFMLVGAYRDSELEDSKLLKQAIQNFNEHEIEVSRISVEELAPESIRELILETFHLSESDLNLLSDLVLIKTRGNPFFSKELIKNLFRTGSIVFDRSDNMWKVERDGLSQIDVSANVAGLISGRINNLAAMEIDCVARASCIGTEFGLEILSRLIDKSETVTRELLDSAIGDGVVTPIESIDAEVQDIPAIVNHNPRFRFSHDQIQQAFLKQLDEPTRKAVHLKIGRIYLADPAFTNATAQVFEACDQLNRALDLVDDSAEIYTIAELNLNAAIEAKNGGAPIAAGDYIQKAIQLIEGLSDESRHQIEHSVYLEAAQICHAKGEFDLSEEFSNHAIGCAKTVHDIAVVHNLSVIRFTMEGAYQDAVDLGASILEQLGVTIPTERVEDALKKELDDSPDLDQIMAPGFVQSAKTMVNEEIKIAMKILVNLFPPTHFVDPNLNGWIAVKMTNLTMAYGFAPESAKGFVNYGSLLALRGEFEAGYQYGKIAIDLIGRFNLPQLKPRVYYAFLGDLMHWKQPLAEARALTNDAYLACIEYGEMAYAGYLLTFARCMNETFLGEDLTEFAERVKESVNFTKSSRNLHAKSVALATAMGIAHLSGETASEFEFDTGESSENELIRGCESRDDFAAIALFRLFQAQNFYFLGHLKDARSAIKAAVKYEKYLGTSMPLAMTRFFDAMISLSGITPATNSTSRQRILENVKVNQDYLEIWASICPENFMHLKLLIEGKLAEVNGEHLNAIGAFVQAVFFAEKEKYNQFTGLGNELLGNIWRSLDNESYFRTHIAKAYDAYCLWNSKTKIKAMRSEHIFLSKPSVRNVRDNESQSVTGTRQSSSSKQEELDLAAIATVTQSISQKINFDELLRALAKAITEISGANKYVLLLNIGNTRRLELKSILSDTVEKHGEEIQDLRDFQHYPAGIINYVSRSQETLKASGKEIRSYSDDIYFESNSPRSILCVPILMQGRGLGVIYLENNELESIFTPERMETINIVCTQAGVSIHNAIMFTSLEQQVREKTRAYTELNSNLEKRVEEQVSEIETLHSFQRFVSPPVAKMLMSEKSKKRLKSHRKEIGILFCDLREFTKYSETVEPEEAMDLLNQYHAIVGKLVNDYEATIDHRAGDGLMIFINDPFDIPNPMEQLVSMALKLRKDVNALLNGFKNQGDKIGFGIGISYGYSTIGMVGYEGRYDYAASGTNVNLASRLCDEAKDGQILLPQKLALSDQVNIESNLIGEVKIKGFSQKIVVYSL